jgi:hypothetical protein
MSIRDVFLVAVLLTAGSATFGADDEREIALGDVPPAAMTAARAAVEGIRFTSAETEVEKGMTIYSLEGNVGGEEYEVEVTAEGEVLEVEPD